MGISASIIFGFTEIKWQHFRAQNLHTLVLQKMLCFRSGPGELDAAWTLLCAEQHLWALEENIGFSSATELMNPGPPENLILYLNFNMQTGAYSWSGMHVCWTASRCLTKCSDAALCLVSCKAELQMARNDGTKISYRSERCWIFSLVNKYLANASSNHNIGFFLKGKTVNCLQRLVEGECSYLQDRSFLQSEK